MPQQAITENTLFYGDNLPILRDYLANESIDLIYLDPTFNSNRSYNVLFREESGHEAEAQITAFEDTWHWNNAAEQTYHDLVTSAPEQVGRMVTALRDFAATAYAQRARYRSDTRSRRSPMSATTAAPLFTP